GDRTNLGVGARQRRPDRAFGQQRAFSASRDLYQPLVRPATWNGGRADLIWAVHRRGGLADGLRAGDGHIWLASDDAGLCPCGRSGDHTAVAVPAPAPAAGPDRRRLARPGAATSS